MPGKNERLKKFIVENPWVTAGIIAGSIGIITLLSVRDFSQRSEILPTSTPFDYCIIKQSKDPIDQAKISGTPIPPVQLFPEGNLEHVIESVDASNIVGGNADGMLNLLLVPVGFDRQFILERNMEVFTKWANMIADANRLNVYASYLNVNLPVSIISLDRTLNTYNLDAVSKFKQLLRSKASYNANVILFDVNSTQPLGSSFDQKYGIAMIASEHPDSFFYMAHEAFGHVIGGLNDAYNSHMQLSGHTELLTTTLALQGWSREVYKEMDGRVTFFPTGGVCNGDLVYSFTKPTKNVMVGFPFDRKEMVSLTFQEMPIFSPFQIGLMQKNIQYRIATFNH